MKNDFRGGTGKTLRAWELCMNPLRGLTKPQIDQMLAQARFGNDARLQVAFQELERNMPIFGICIEKRLAGIVNREWRITPDDPSEESKERAGAVQKMFERCERRNVDGLTEALRHLGLAAFRGRSCVKPFFAEDGSLILKKLDNWNVLEMDGRLKWCPDDNFGAPLPDVTDEVCWVRCGNPVDVPGIQIYLRQLVGEEQWARFVEKSGIAQVLLTAPEGTPDSQLGPWTERAMRIFEGGSGVLPPGAQVNELTAARGQDPFSEYVRHQMEMVCLIALGGSLNTIGGSTGLGSNLAEIQDSALRSLVNQDCRKISNSVSDVVVAACARKLGYDRPLCRFEFVEDRELGAEDYLGFAERLAKVGVKIDARKLKALTGLDFIDDGSSEWTPSGTSETSEISVTAEGDVQ